VTETARWACSLLLVAGAACAQETNLRTTVRLVVAPTTVVDSAGHYVDGLSADDFLVYDNGQPRRVNADVGYVPISLVIAVQSGSIAAEAINKMRRIGSLVEPLIIGDRGEVAVVSYASDVLLMQPFTSDPDNLSRGLQRLRAGGDGGRMIDAVAESVRMLAARPPNRRRVLLLVGESRDRGSQTKLEEAVTLTQRENVAVYALTYSAMAIAFTARAGSTPQEEPECGNCTGPPVAFPTLPFNPAQGQSVDLLKIVGEIMRLGKTNAATAFTDFSGGTRLSFLKQRGLETALARIGEELHAQYMLSFTAPAESTAEFHKIEVRVKNRPELTIRTRPGYWLAGPG
jgi:VWFA-related protein